MRAAALALLLAGCVHAPPKPPTDVVVCALSRVGLALAADLVGPVIMGERNGTITVDARSCGPGVLSEADAARLSLGLVSATTAAVSLAKLAGGPCVDVWADAVGATAASLGATLPTALAGSGVVRVEWSAPECAP